MYPLTTGLCPQAEVVGSQDYILIHDKLTQRRPEWRVACRCLIEGPLHVHKSGSDTAEDAIKKFVVEINRREREISE